MILNHLQLSANSDKLVIKMSEIANCITGLLLLIFSAWFAWATTVMVDEQKQKRKGFLPCKLEMEMREHGVKKAKLFHRSQN